jgi:predicted membrane protein
MSDSDEFPRRRGESESPEPSEPRRANGARWFRSQFLIGAAIIVIGAALLLDNLGVMDSGDILRLWPTILIAVGLRDLFVASDGSRAMRGTLLIAFGALLLLNTFEVFEFSIIGLWPLFLILFGANMLVRNASRRSVSEGEYEPSQDSEFDDFAFLGGVKRSIRSLAFRGGSASAFMGGVDIDLTDARMQGERAVINVFAMMGGVVLRVPEDWVVQSNVTALMGGVDDKTRPPAEPAGTLVLEGSAILGGIEIKG